MIIGHIRGFTRTLGKSQGYQGLPIRDLELYDPATQRIRPAMQTLWHPSPDELALLLKGGGVKLTLLGNGHPPVMIEAISKEEFDPIPDRSTPEDVETTEGKPAEMAEEKD